MNRKMPACGRHPELGGEKNEGICLFPGGKSKGSDDEL